jgi:hypothetical protein
VATKAELEAELAKLRLELKEIRNTSEADTKTADDTAKENSDRSQSSKDSGTENPAPKEETVDIIQSLQDGDFGGVVHQLMEELEGLPNRKPLLMALGAFVAGYLVGRSGNKG